MHVRKTLAVAVLAAAAVGAASTGHAAPPAPPATTAQSQPTATAAAPVCGLLSATNAALQTRTLTTNDATVYGSTAWTSLACGTLTVSAPRGRTALTTVNVDAEVTCTGADGQWCLGRVLIGNAEGAPAAPEPDSFAWANSEPNAGQWESNAFTRSRVLACPRTWPTPTCVWTVRVQVRNHVAGLSFRVDDSTVKAQSTYF